jgi:hypothetical protein
LQESAPAVNRQLLLDLVEGCVARTLAPQDGTWIGQQYPAGGFSSNGVRTGARLPNVWILIQESLDDPLLGPILGLAKQWPGKRKERVCRGA